MRRMPLALALLAILTTAPLIALAEPPVARERASPAYDADGNRIFDDLDAALAAARPEQEMQVIAVFTGATAEQGLARATAAAAGARVLFAYPSLPGAALALPARDVPRLAALDEVRQVELVVEGRRELSTSTQYIGARHVWTDLGVTGDADGNPGVFSKDDATIAVLDTGIHASHLDFAGGKLIAWHDTVSGAAVPSDTDGHGTHVSSIAAGRGLADPENKGVAPGASLVLVRISNKAHALAAVQWVIDHKDQYGIDVMTMSFGFGIGADGTDSLAQLFDQAFLAGVVTVKSTGNSGPEHGTMTIPADAHYILATGALEDPGKTGWKLATFSSRGPTTDGRVKPDISAPGVGILAAAAGTTNGYTTLSGTSMAAPHTAGVAALVKAANPSLTAAQIRQIVVDTAQDRGRPGADNDYGAGLVDPYAAVQRARGLTGSNPVTQPAMEARVDGHSGSDTWVFELGAGSKQLAITLLTELPPGPTRRVSMALVGPTGSIAVAPQPPLSSASRHHNLHVNAPAAGTYVVEVVGLPGGDYTIDLSGNWAPGALHGLHLSP